MRLPFESPAPEVLVRVDRSTGEWVLRRREVAGAARFEIIQNGRLLMDTADGASEGALARLGLARCAGDGGLRVLVGGLGFGFTLRAVLRDPRVGAVEVVELEPSLPELVTSPALLEAVGRLDLGDPRVRVRVGDVRDAIERARAAFDCILLDVDNGPRALSAPGNSALYGDAGLRACRRALAPGGALAIWSEGPAPEVLDLLRAAFGGAEEVAVPASRDGRRLEYVILLAGGAQG